MHLFVQRPPAFRKRAASWLHSVRRGRLFAGPHRALVGPRLLRRALRRPCAFQSWPALALPSGRGAPPPLRRCGLPQWPAVPPEPQGRPAAWRAVDRAPSVSRSRKFGALRKAGLFIGYHSACDFLFACHELGCRQPSGSPAPPIWTRQADWRLTADILPRWSFSSSYETR